MSIVALSERLQDTWVSQVISGTTWGYPIVGALHVLAMTVFGGTVLYTNLCAFGIVFRGQELAQAARDVRLVKLVGLAMVLATGALLFASGAAYYYVSAGFRVKMVLLALVLLNAAAVSPRFPRLHAGISLALWAGVVFAARGIAFF